MGLSVGASVVGDAVGGGETGLRVGSAVIGDEVVGSGAGFGVAGVGGGVGGGVGLLATTEDGVGCNGGAMGLRVGCFVDGFVGGFIGDFDGGDTAAGGSSRQGKNSQFSKGFRGTMLPPGQANWSLLHVGTWFTPMGDDVGGDDVGDVVDVFGTDGSPSGQEKKLQSRNGFRKTVAPLCGHVCTSFSHKLVSPDVGDSGGAATSVGNG